MAADKTLQLTIVVNGVSAIPAAMQQAAASVTANTSQITASFNQAAVSANLLTASAKQTGSALQGIKGQADLGNAFGGMTQAVEKTDSSMRNARITAMGLGQEFGIHLPRVVSSFLAKSQTIGPILSAAFSTVAVIGMIQILAQLPGLYEKLTSYVTGWDDAAKKAAEDQIRLNNEAQVTVTERLKKETELQEIGLTGTAKLIAQQKALAEQEALTAKQAAAFLQQGVKITKVGSDMEELNQTVLQNGALWEYALLRVYEWADGSSEAIAKGKKGQEELNKLATQQTKEWFDEKQREVALNREVAASHMADSRAMVLAEIDSVQKIRDASISAAEETASREYQVGRVSADQLASTLEFLEDQKFAIAQTGFERRRALLLREQSETGKAVGPDLERLNADKVAAETAHQAKVAAIRAKGIDETQKQSEEVSKVQIEAALRSTEEQVTIAEDLANKQYAMHAITHEQEHVQLVSAEKVRMEAQRESINAQLELAKQFPEKNKAQIATLNAQLEQLEISSRGRILAIDEEYDLREEEDARKLADVQRQAAEDSGNRQLELARTVNDERLRTHQESLQTWARMERVAIDEWYTHQRQVMAQALAEAEKLHQKDSAEYAKVVHDMEKLDAERAQKKAIVDKTMSAAQQRVLDQMTGEFNRNLMSWMAGQETFGQAVVRSWGQISSSMISNMLKMAEQEVASAALHKLLGKEDIHTSAAKAAAAQYHKAIATLTIPAPFNMIVAGAEAAAVFAATAAFASFDRGGVVPDDMLANVHKNEMVLDPVLSSGIQNMIRNGGAQSDSQAVVPDDMLANVHKNEMAPGGVYPEPVAANISEVHSTPPESSAISQMFQSSVQTSSTAHSSHTVHLNYNPTIYGSDSSGFKKLLREHSKELTQIMKTQSRRGNLPSAP